MDDPELAEVFAAPNPEAVIRRHLAKYVDDLRARAAELGYGGWRPGQPLVLLLAGYNGAGNIGADIRVVEMIRQIRAVLTPQRVEIRLVTIGEQLEWTLFPDIRPELITTYFPRAL